MYALFFQKIIFKGIILNHENAIERRMESSPVTQEELLRENRDNLEKCRFYGCDYLLIDESYNVEIML